MSRLTDNLEALEHELDKCRGDDAGSLLNRRFVLRAAMESWGRERYDEGHYDGGRDERDARREAQRRADEAAKETEDG